MKALLIPMDAPISVVEADTYRELAAFAGINWVERVVTQALHDHHTAMMVDEDGHQKQLGLNIRAMILSGYKGPIVGNVIIAGETRGFDINFVSISDEALAWARKELEES